MPIKKAAKKAMRQTRKKTIVNKAKKTQIKKMVKDARKKIEAKKEKDVLKVIAKISAEVDRAAKRGLLHKNKAARIKSRLMKKLNKTLGGKVKLEKRERIAPKPKSDKKEPAKKITKSTKSKKK
jgi:small subunit ribosomal protein S20